MSPLSEARAATLVRFMAERADDTVLDVGCGWGELLLRVLDASPELNGVGVDTDEAALAHGGELARRRGLADRVTLTCADGRTAVPVGGVICIGASQIWGPPVQDNQPLDYASALEALRKLVPRGAPVVYGEAIWSRPPTPGAVAPLAGRNDEYVTLEALVELAVTHGFMPMVVEEATGDEWDVFESGYHARYTRWLAEHDADDPDAPEVRARADRQRAAYLGGYRSIMGMAYLSLVAV